MIQHSFGPPAKRPYLFIYDCFLRSSSSQCASVASTDASNGAKRVGLLNEVPTIEKVKRAAGSKLMRGRPISGEEFERLLGKVPEMLDGMYPCKPGRERPQPTPEEADRRADLSRSTNRR